MPKFLQFQLRRSGDALLIELDEISSVMSMPSGYGHGPYSVITTKNGKDFDVADKIDSVILLLRNACQEQPR